MHTPTAFPCWRTCVPTTVNVFWDVILTTNRGVNAIEDVFIFVADTCDISIRIVDAEDDEGMSGV